MEVNISSPPYALLWKSEDFHRTIYRNLKWNAFPFDHCWRTDGVDETFPDRFGYV